MGYGGSGRDQRETFNIQAAEDKTRTRPDMDLEQVLKLGGEGEGQIKERREEGEMRGM